MPGQAVPGPYGRGKLAPLLSLFTAEGEDDGIRLCRRILGNGGRGHTAIIHTRSKRLQSSFARQMPVSRVLVNGPGSQGCIGLGNGLTPSLTLGCGTYGRTSTTDNVTYTNLVNIKRVAHPLAGPGAPAATPLPDEGMSDVVEKALTKRSPVHPPGCRAIVRPGRVPGQHAPRHEQPAPPCLPVRGRHLPPQQFCRTACAARPKLLCAGALVRDTCPCAGVD